MLFNTQRNNLANNLAGRSNMNGPTSGIVYIGLSTTKPNADGTGITEPTGQGYERKLIGNYSIPTTQKMGAAVDGVSKNVETIFFEEVRSTWGTLRYAVFFSSLTGGTPLFYAELKAPVTPALNTVPLMRKDEGLIISADSVEAQVG